MKTDDRVLIWAEKLAGAIRDEPGDPAVNLMRVESDMVKDLTFSEAELARDLATAWAKGRLFGCLWLGRQLGRPGPVDCGAPGRAGQGTEGRSACD